MTTNQNESKTSDIEQVRATNLRMLNDILKVWQVNYQNFNWGGGVVDGEEVAVKDS